MAVWRQACVSASLGLGSRAAAWARQPLAAGRGTGMREVPQRVPWPCHSPAPRFLLLVSALDQLQRTGRSRREARVEGSGPARRPPPGRAGGTSGPFSPPSVGTRSPPRGRACTPVSAGSSCPTVGSAGEGVGLGRDRLCWLEAAVPQEDSGLPCHRRGEERRKGSWCPRPGGRLHPTRPVWGERRGRQRVCPGGLGPSAPPATQGRRWGVGRLAHASCTELPCPGQPSFLDSRRPGTSQPVACVQPARRASFQGQAGAAARPPRRVSELGLALRSLGRFCSSTPGGWWLRLHLLSSHVPSTYCAPGVELENTSQV